MNANNSNPGSMVQVMRKATGRKQIVMFPFGGGSGYSFVSIINEIPRDTGIIVINPPGHMMNGGRALETIDAMVRAYSKELLPVLKETALFFGHSIGGIVAYEICKAIRHTLPVKHMVISSVNPPHHTVDEVDLRSDMETALLVEKCTQLGGMPHIFQQEPELLDGFINGLRADLKALEHYGPGAAPPGTAGLTTQTTVLYSDKDYIVNPAKIRHWDQYLDCKQFIPFHGDHFYLFEQNNLKTVARILTDRANQAAVS